ncbi:DegV family protein [Bacillus sp. B15-48]|uniref:DegV family protein n=1 Tax=Bacillus sp. B15-48 TaxID=1548601 RepID=UPI00193FBB71|nr:DegV family protein [Bacillus sp. B15-48]MBM4764213.1 DegV family EDD domain-containing protein [Bacillus sp. B15-48]
MGVKIIADSACDLPIQFFEKNDVTMIPLKVLIDNNEYEDQKTIQPNEVYNQIRNGKHPKTSQPSQLAFKEAFVEIAKSKQPGIYIAFTSELSGTYQTAVMVHEQVKEEYPDIDLTIVDTKCASLGFGLVVMEAVRMAKNNATKEEILSDIRFRCLHMEHLFTVDDLDYLAKGGRLSKASAFLGGILNIKPLLNVEDGKLVPIEKIRGKKKLLNRMIELMKERGNQMESQIIGISHGDDLTTANEMKEKIVQAFQPKEVVITSVGATIGSHTGPGTIAIFFLNKLPS